jgi:quinol monooxygenase YgiN
MTKPNDTVTVTLTVTLKPEVVDEFCARLPEMIKDTAAFAGFRSLRALQHKTERGRLLMIEEWDSEAAYLTYMEWRVKSGSMEELKQIVAAPPEVNFWPSELARA